MQVFNIEFNMIGTAYIVADTLERAQELFDQRFINNGYMHNEDGDFVNGDDFEAMLESGEEMVTMSPAVTLVGACEDSKMELMFP